MVNWSQVLEAGARGLQSVGVEANAVRNAQRMGEAGLTHAADNAAAAMRGGNVPVDIHPNFQSIAHDPLQMQAAREAYPNGLPIHEDLRASYANDLMAKAQVDNDAWINNMKQSRGIAPDDIGGNSIPLGNSGFNLNSPEEIAYAVGRQPARAWDMVASNKDVALNVGLMSPMFLPAFMPGEQRQPQQQQQLQQLQQQQQQRLEPQTQQQQFNQYLQQQQQRQQQQYQQWQQ